MLHAALLAIRVLAGSPSSPEPAPSVAILPVEGDIALAPADQALAEQRLRQALVTPEYRVATRDQSAALARCTDRTCRERTLRSHGVSYWLITRVRGRDRVYEIDLELWSTGAQNALVRTHDRCSVCGTREVINVIAALALDMRRWLVRQTGSPATLVVRPRPRRATVSVDGRAVGRGVTTVEVTPGPHTVRVEAWGRPAQEREVTASSGVVREVDIATPLASSRDRALRWGGVGSIAAGAGTLVAGAVLLGLDGREYGPRCGGSSVHRDADGDCRFIHETRTGGYAALAVGLALTGAGTALLLWSSPRSPSSSSRMSLGVSGRGVTLSGRF